MILTILLTALETIGFVLGVLAVLGFIGLLMVAMNVPDNMVEFYEHKSREDILNAGSKGDDTRADN